MKKNGFYLIFTFISVFLLIFLIVPFITSSTKNSVWAQTLVSNTSLTTNLKIGDRNPQVLLLQQILNSDSDTTVSTNGPGSKGNETTYFGRATKNAVIHFQEKYATEILRPSGLSSGTGFVGALTRAKLNDILKTISSFIPSVSTTLPSNSPTVTSNVNQNPIVTQNPPSNSPTITTSPSTTPLTIPIIQKISPVSGPNGSQITITGLNFSPLNTIYTSYKIIPNVASTDGKTIQFTFAVPAFDKLQAIRNKGGKLGDIDIPFFINIVNSFGSTTLPATFTVQIRKQ